MTIRDKHKLVKNCIQCNHCGDIIESKYTHDFVWCSCQTVAVDGGLDYAKRTYKYSPDDFTDLSKWEKKSLFKKKNNEA